MQNETFKTWLQKKPGDPYKARCKVCAKDTLVGLHGITAFFSHADGTSKQTTSVCTNKQLVTKAEVIWALDVVISKYIFN